MAQAGRVDVHDKNLSLEELIAGWSEWLLPNRLVEWPLEAKLLTPVLL
jgi:hypothetical protein